MNKMKKTLVLQNGNLIPTLAYGTWLINDDIVTECVKNAIKVGYRHIDTAQVYENEVGVGKGVTSSLIYRRWGLPTQEI